MSGDPAPHRVYTNDDIVFKAKIILLGSLGSGKSTFLDKLAIPNKEVTFDKYLGVRYTKFLLNTSVGVVEYTFWDTIGQECLNILRDAYYIESHYALYFYDVTSSNSYCDLSTWMAFVNAICNLDVVAYVANKIDLPKRLVFAHNAKVAKRSASSYMETSLTSNYHVTDLLLMITRDMFHDTKLTFVDPVPLTPPTTEMPKELKDIYEQEASSFAATPIVQQNVGFAQATRETCLKDDLDPGTPMV